MSNANRRAFLRSIAATGLSAPLLPRALDAQIQAGTIAVSVETIRAAAQLAGLTWTDEECAQLTDALSRMAKGAEGIDRRSLTNASPLPVALQSAAAGCPARGASGDLPARAEAAAAETGFGRGARVRDDSRTGRASARTARDVGRSDAHVSRPAEVGQRTAQLRGVARGTARAVRSGCGGSRDRGRARSRVAARHSVWREGHHRRNGAPTEWGAAPTKGQTFAEDATVVARLSEAGAVLVAKLTTGEMAFGDQWAGGRTNNPWNPRQGSSGSSAGPGSATAAGLVGFSIGTDTGGSILSPAARCGVVGLRPTFGRVSRHGVMTAGSTLDKIGPMCRHGRRLRDRPARHRRAGRPRPRGPGTDAVRMGRDEPVASDADRVRPLDVRGHRRPRCRREQRPRARDAAKHGVHAGRGDASVRRPELLHRVHRTCRGVRLLHERGPVQGAAAADRPVSTRVSIDDRGRLPAGESPPPHDHAAGRRRDARCGRRSSSRR